VDDFDGWKEFLADLVGLSWDKIFAAAAGVFSREIELILYLYQTAADWLDKGWGGLTGWLEERWAEVKEKLLGLEGHHRRGGGAVRAGLVETARRSWPSGWRR